MDAKSLNIYFFILSVLFFILALIIRAIRWDLLLVNGVKVEKKYLTVYNAISSILNLVFPFRLGDISRIYFLSRLHNIRLSISISSIVQEKLLDIFYLFLISTIFYLFTTTNIINIINIVLAVLFFIFLINVYELRRFLLKISLIFNRKLRSIIFEIIWLIRTQLKFKVYLKRRCTSLSSIMWLLYFISYYFLSLSLNINITEIIHILHNAPMDSRISFFQNNEYSFYIILFIVTPSIITTFSVFIFTLSKMSSLKKILSSIGKYYSQNHHGFNSFFSYDSNASYEKFFEQFYSLDSLKILDNLNTIFTNDKIENFYSVGSSGAFVVLVTNKNKEHFIRKITSRNSYRKLMKQYNWLIETKKNLPVIKPYNFYSSKNYCYFDMKFDNEYISLDTWINQNSEKDIKIILKNIFISLKTHHEKNLKSANFDTLFKKFYDRKIKKNIDKIFKILNGNLNLCNFKINGLNYDIADWSFLRNFDLLSSQQYFKFNSDIHGDVTFQNILVKDHSNWILIDPNNSDEFKNPLIDYSKLLQSSNSLYDLYNLNHECLFNYNEIKFKSLYSKKYNMANKFLKNIIIDNYSENALREIYLYEIFNYLRLIPYQFEKSFSKGILFFALTCILIKKYRINYIDKSISI